MHRRRSQVGLAKQVEWCPSKNMTGATAVARLFHSRTAVCRLRYNMLRRLKHLDLIGFPKSINTTHAAGTLSRLLPWVGVLFETATLTSGQRLRRLRASRQALLESLARHCTPCVASANECSKNTSRTCIHRECITNKYTAEQSFRQKAAHLRTQ